MFNHQINFHLESDLLHLLDKKKMFEESAFLKQLHQEKVAGIVLVGSSSRKYGDVLSDHDYEVIVSDDYYLSIALSRRLFRETTEAGAHLEYFILSQSDFLAKKNSPADIDHWPYIECKILYDPSRKIMEEIQLISRLPENTRNDRLKLHYFEFLFAIKRIERLIIRGDALNLRMTASLAVFTGIKLAFLCYSQWPPVMHWVAQTMEELPIRPSKLKGQLRSFLDSPTIAGADQLLLSIDEMLAGQGYDFIWHKEILGIEVASLEFRKIRELYGTL